VFAVQGRDDIVIGILRNDDVALLEAEIGLLNRLKAAGVPTVKVLGITTHDGRPAIVMERMVLGSKNVVNSKKGKVEIVGESELLNARSIKDLNLIKKRMQKAQIRVHDLQFLIGADGRVVVADPVDVLMDENPSATNLQTIDQLILAAQRNLPK